MFYLTWFCFTLCLSVEMMYFRAEKCLLEKFKLATAWCCCSVPGLSWTAIEGSFVRTGYQNWQLEENPVGAASQRWDHKWRGHLAAPKAQRNNHHWKCHPRQIKRGRLC